MKATLQKDFDGRDGPWRPGVLKCRLGFYDVRHRCDEPERKLGSKLGKWRLELLRNMTAGNNTVEFFAAKFRFSALKTLNSSLVVENKVSTFFNFSSRVASL